MVHGRSGSDFRRAGVKLNTPPLCGVSFYAYRTPDLREIYHFTDSLGKGEPLENFKICSADQAPYLWLDSMKLAQYQYRTSSNPDVSPYYISVNNKLNFDVQYFWTDLIPDKNTRWVEVTTDTTFVDTTSNVRFRQSGFYKMRIVAYNECGYDPDTHGLLYIDSLWTDSLKNSPDKRYFQVYEPGGGKTDLPERFDVSGRDRKIGFCRPECPEKFRPCSRLFFCPEKRR